MKWVYITLGIVFVIVVFVWLKKRQAEKAAQVQDTTPSTTFDRAAEAKKNFDKMEADKKKRQEEQTAIEQQRKAQERDRQMQDQQRAEEEARSRRVNEAYQNGIQNILNPAKMVLQNQKDASTGRKIAGVLTGGVSNLGSIFLGW